MSYLSESPEYLKSESWIHTLHPDMLADMDAVVALSGASHWIRLFRQPVEGPLDIEATAAAMGVPIIEDSRHPRPRGETKGVPLDDAEEPLAIYLDHGCAREDRRFTMGHEMGHLYLEALGYRHRAYSEVAEDFCHAMAREITMPNAAIKDIGHVDERVLKGKLDEFGVELEHLLLRLMRAKKLPRKVAIDSGLDYAENDKYAGVVCRQYVCIDNVDGRDCAPADYDIPVFDFSDKEWWGRLSGCSTEPDYFWRPELHTALTDRYFPGGRQLALFSQSKLNS